VVGPVDATNVQQLAAHLRATAGSVDAPAGPEAGG
jgi:hypothetical protein